MPDATTPAARAAKYGDKMIEVRVRFWTDHISGQGNTIVPKHAWDNGVVVMDTNKSHGIKPASPVPFNSILDLTSVLRKLLFNHGVVLHANPTSRKLIQP